MFYNATNSIKAIQQITSYVAFNINKHCVLDSKNRYKRTVPMLSNCTVKL